MALVQPCYSVSTTFAFSSSQQLLVSSSSQLSRRKMGGLDRRNHVRIITNPCVIRNRKASKNRPFIFKCNAAIGDNNAFEVAEPSIIVDDDLNESPTSVESPITLSHITDIQRKHFPSDFIFGAGTSAIQIEGSGTEGGRGPSTWDSTIKAEEGGKGADSYTLYQEDVKALKKMGVDYYRFSISWPRILPDGDPRKVNPDGLRYYTALLEELEKNGIKPMVTLFHFDLPLALQEKYNGFMDRRIINDFRDYCDICFQLFSKWVKHWVTINEAATYVLLGNPYGFNGNTNDPMSPYIQTHNLILAHAAAAKLYKDKYKNTYGGEVGMSLVCKWSEPLDDKNKDDHDAVRNGFERFVGWYLGPLRNGDYPPELKNWVVGLPTFSPEESELVKGSCDFIGINYYSGSYATTVKEYSATMGGHTRTESIQETPLKDGVYIGPSAKGLHDIYVYPEGLLKMLLHIKTRYNNPPVYITENGVSAKTNNITLSKKDAEAMGYDSMVNVELKDDYRINAIKGHLCAVYTAKQNRVNVKGYFVWSLLDNSEFGDYDIRFGLVYVDYLDNHKRYLKSSADWFGKFLGQ